MFLVDHDVEKTFIISFRCMEDKNTFYAITRIFKKATSTVSGRMQLDKDS